MKITLMRHGQPDWQDGKWCSPHAMQRWCAAYDAADVSDTPPSDAIAAANRAAIRVTSTLPRALSSLARLGHVPCYADPLYREAVLPLLRWRLPVLPPAVWLVLFRLMWLCGFSGRAESLSSARRRAKNAAVSLASLARHGDVLLIGHGIINRLIAQELREMGWQREKGAQGKCWSYAVLTKASAGEKGR